MALPQIYLNCFYNSRVQTIIDIKFRKVYFNDIKRYAGKDNLANLYVNIDNSSIEILDSENNRIEKEPIIESEMLKKDKVKILEF